MALREKHQHALVIRQRVEVRAPVGWDHGRSRPALPTSGRERAQRRNDVKSLWHDPHDPLSANYRPNALMTAEELERVADESADVRATFSKLKRRISTWDHAFTPLVDRDHELYPLAHQQARAVSRWFSGPLNRDGDTWVPFWTMVLHDTLVHPHGAFEHVYRETVDPTSGQRRRGFLVEFVPLFGGGLHPVPGKNRRIGGYVQDNGSDGTPRTKDKLRELGSDVVTRLQLDPNTASLYSKPLIETAVKEITTLFRSSARVAEEFDSDLPPGFLVISSRKTPEMQEVLKQQVRRHHGQDSKMRVLYAPGNTVEPKWMTLERRWRELDLLPVIKRAERVWWRLVGVTPADMGEVEDANRSNMDAQLDVGSSHLIDPLLEEIERIVNQRMLQAVVDMLYRQENTQLLVGFAFDRTQKLSTAELLEQEEARDKQLRNGTRTPNELRAEDGLDGYEGGELFRLDGQTIGSADPDADPPEPQDDNDGGGSDRGGPSGRSAQVPPVSTPAVVQNRKIPPVVPEAPEPAAEAVRAGSLHRRQNRLASLLASAALVQAGESVERLYAVQGADALRWKPRTVRAADDLPSAWQSPSAFDGENTLNLRQLADVVGDYRRAIQPLWDAARANALAVTALAAQRGVLGSVGWELSMQSVYDDLRDAWEAATAEFYERAALEAHQSVSAWLDSDEDTEGQALALATAYATNAMGYLDALFESLQGRAADAAERLDEDGVDAVLAQLEHGWDANEHRIDNWSGRLVELANAAAAATVIAAGDLVLDPVTGEERSDPWMVLWVDTNDGVECETCLEEGSIGWRPVAELTRHPGGDTDCRARCRCGLIYRRQSELN